MQNYELKEAFSCGVLLFITVLIFFYFGWTGWVILAPFFMSQTTHGTRLRQYFYLFFLIVIALQIAFLIKLQFFSTGFLFTLLAIIFILLNCLVLFFYPINKQMWSALFIPFLVFMLAILFPFKPATLPDILIEITLGMLIGIIINQIFLRFPMEKEFKQSLNFFLKNINEYSESLRLLNLNPNDKMDANLEKENIEIFFQEDDHIYPDWIYEVGFNPGLRQGYRFFLLRLETLVDKLMVIHNLLLENKEKSADEVFSDLIDKVMRKNEELLTGLQQIINQKRPDITNTDYQTDILDLEHYLKNLLPSSLELIDITPSSKTMIALVKLVKEIRAITFELILSQQTREQI